MRQHLALVRRLRLPPLWTVALAIVGGVLVALWRSISAMAVTPEHFIRGLLWPGAPVAAAIYAFAWLGWALDID